MVKRLITVSTYLLNLIREGEHKNQDFKYCISDSKKIAKSLVAFANSDGGRLLIGVKDNGNIAGVRSDEEFYMIEAAAKIYSNPEIEFTYQQHHIDGKIVLEIQIERSPNKPHFAKDENGKWLAYFRQHDENKLANYVLIEVWRKQKSPKGIFVNYSDTERLLLDYLTKNKTISQSHYSKKARITYKNAGKIISDFIVLGILNPDFSEKKMVFSLADNFDWDNWNQF